MPSDDRAAAALAALQPQRDAFLSAVSAAVEEVRAFVEARRPRPEGAASDRAALELGAFAAGRIDAGRFAATFAGGAALDAAALARVEHALGELTLLAATGDAAFRAEVRRRADLHMVVGHALASAGRAFGAAQTVELVRLGRWKAEEHTGFTDAFPFRRWNRAERQIAPPLVVECEGTSLHAGGLAEFLDGTMKVVLVVRPPCPPAALVRLITPNVFVMQARGAAELERIGRFSGPGVAALVPEGAARFVHDPLAGRTVRERLCVEYLPEDDAVAPVNGISAFQQHEELALLRELASAPAAGPGPAPADAGDVDRLAAWLLRQAELG